MGARMGDARSEIVALLAASLAVVGCGGSIEVVTTCPGSGGTCDASPFDDASLDSTEDAGANGLDAVTPPPPALDGPAVPVDASGAVLLCGTTPCDLRTSTCCVTLAATGTCIPQGQTCPAQTAAFSCQKASDCARPGEICCGDLMPPGGSLLAQTSCQTPASGGSCPALSPLGGAQLCTTSDECTNGMPCVSQTCTPAGTGLSVQAHVSLCGLQMLSFVTCVAN
jgi:hypothetical protein